jgi:hypothetical protein
MIAEVKVTSSPPVTASVLGSVNVSRPVDPGDAVGLEEVADAAGHPLHHRGLPLVRRREVKVRAAELDAKLAERFVGLFQRQRRLRPGFGRDAADAQACPAKLGRPVDAGDPGAELRGADRGGLTAGAAAENGDVNVHH